MTTMNEREQAFEAKFAHDAEFQFLLNARRDKLFAHWAAAAAGIAGDAEDALVSDVLAIPNGPDHDPALLRYIQSTMAGRGVIPAATDVLAALDRCAKDAFAHLSAHPPERSEIV